MPTKTWFSPAKEARVVTPSSGHIRKHDVEVFSVGQNRSEIYNGKRHEALTHSPASPGSTIADDVRMTTFPEFAPNIETLLNSSPSKIFISPKKTSYDIPGSFLEDSLSSTSSVQENEQKRYAPLFSPSPDGYQRDEIVKSFDFDPTPVRKAKKLEEDLLGHLQELESLTVRLLPSELDEGSFQRREEQQRFQEELLVLVRTIQSKQQDNAKSTDLNLQEQLEKMTGETKLREARFEQEINDMRKTVHELSISMDTQNNRNTACRGEATYDQPFVKSAFMLAARFIGWLLFSIPFSIAKATLWLVHLSIIVVALTSHAPLPYLDNVPGVS
eukprot:scaffold25607_cov142-Cylindrotheca_fusiformis.AAC.2